ncbi:GIY-YIG nuclease family protein [Rahnella variigena]|uniref:GIY-YIG nuclease family protein n=1 Tax=Rahnella variigena TaxID=574964 RepID=UPI0028DB63D8|nr:GIY-YIG nuclease family protein [Rahnella variigena]
MHLNAAVKQPGILNEMSIPNGFRMNGWVYILSNDYMPGIYKIGMTTTSPEARCKELSSATGVPAPFKIEATFHCESAANSEAEIHSYLSDYRVNESREFFEDDLDELITACEEHTQANTATSVQMLADTYDVISFESLDELNLPSLFEDIGIQTFGDRLAIAERLMRLGAEMIMANLNKNGCSAVFSDDRMYAVKGAEWQWREQMEKDQQEFQAAQEAIGICGPQLQVEF